MFAPLVISNLTYSPVTVPGSLPVENAYHWLAHLLILVLALQRLICSQLNSMLYRVVVHKVATLSTINEDQQRRSQHEKIPVNIGKTQLLPAESVGR